MNDKEKLRELLEKLTQELQPYLEKFEDTWPRLESHLADISHHAESAISEIDQ